jgi:hypothetical protein
VESDPIGLLGGAHSTFAYAYDDPVEFTDPFGLEPPGGAVAFRDAIRDLFFGGRFPTKEFRSDGMPQVGAAGTNTRTGWSLISTFSPAAIMMIAMTTSAEGTTVTASF